jgi:iron complex transport system substrate-binding protein
VSPGPDGFPRLVATPLGNVLVPARPRRLVPANAPAADFAIALLGDEAHERIALVSPETVLYSHLATELAPWPQQRVGAHGAEYVLSAEPDLVFDADWQDAGTRARLQRAGVPIVTLPTVVDVADMWAALELAGRALGEEERAAQLVTSLTEQVAALGARGAARGESVLFYSNLGSGGSAAGAHTTSALLVSIAGLVNAAADFDGHVECSHELLIALDPDWIVVGESGAGETGTTRRHLTEHTDLVVLRAVAGGRIAELPRTLATSSSHTIVAAAQALLDELDRIAPSASK